MLVTEVPVIDVNKKHGNTKSGDQCLRFQSMTGE
jgi:hypothetical protein